jgi:hypothetical protein
MRLKPAIYLGIVVLGAAAIGARILNVKYGKGEALVIAPAGHPLSVVVDGGPTAAIAGGAYRRFTLPQGIHSFAITDATRGTTVTRNVETNAGNSHKLVSASDDQCFVSLDVALSHYSVEKGKTGGRKPSVHQRFKNTQKPFELFRDTRLSEDELPKKVGATAGVYLLRDTPCAALAAPDGELVARLGY